MSSSSLVTSWDSTQRVLLQSWKIFVPSIICQSHRREVERNEPSVCQSLDNSWNVPSNAELSGMLDQLCDGGDTAAESEEQSERSDNC